jgi:hypothetical protein
MARMVDEHIWVLGAAGPPPPPTHVDAEIVDALGRDPQVWAIALDLLRIIDEGETPDLYTWPAAIALLTEYRARGGSLACPIDAVAVTVRALLAALAADLDGTADRIRGEAAEALRANLRAGAGRLRAALGVPDPD